MAWQDKNGPTRGAKRTGAWQLRFVMGYWLQIGTAHLGLYNATYRWVELLPYGPTHAWLLPLMSVCAFASYLILFYSDPGWARTNPSALQLSRELWETNALLYPTDVPLECSCLGMDHSEEEEAAYALLERVPRSKHCTDGCGECVLRFDHHCVWANKCIGLFNLRWFLLFLAVTSVLCAYAAALSLGVLFCKLETREDMALLFVAQLLYVAVYCTCTAIVLAGLFLVSTRQILTNITAYETMKRERLQRAFEMLKKGKRSKVLPVGVTHLLQECIDSGSDCAIAVMPYRTPLCRRVVECLLPELLLSRVQRRVKEV